MSRPPRIEYKNAVYYVSVFGDSHNDVFPDSVDRIRFLEILKQTIKRYGWLCHGYCLLNDHFHLLIETPTLNLSLGMRQVNGIYTQFYNRKYNYSGSLFRGRFKSIIIEKDRYLLPLSRHLSLNPVRLALVEKPQQWEWSSYPQLAGYIEIDTELLFPDWLLGQVGKKTKKAKKSYRKYIKEDKKHLSPLLFIESQIYLGSEEFIKSIKDLHNANSTGAKGNKSSSMNRPQLRSILKPSLVARKKSRNKQILIAHIEHGYLLKEIAAFLKLHHTTVSKIINASK